MHAFAAIGRDDADPCAYPGGHLHRVRKVHRAGVEGGNLVIVYIGRNVSLGGIGIGDDAYVIAGHAVTLQPLSIGLEVRPCGSQWVTALAEQSQIVGDITGAAPELLAQLRHEKGHVKDMHLLGQDMIAEAVLEDHDGVEGERSADYGGHADSLILLVCPAFRRNSR